MAEANRFFQVFAAHAMLAQYQNHVVKGIDLVFTVETNTQFNRPASALKTARGTTVAIIHSQMSRLPRLQFQHG